MEDLEKLVEEGRRTGKVTFTSAEANKMLRMLNDSRDMDLSEEREKCTFIAATIEKVEDVRPEYDFGKAQKDVAQMEKAIRKLKHEINRFNVSTKEDQRFFLRLKKLDPRAQKHGHMRFIENLLQI